MPDVISLTPTSPGLSTFSALKKVVNPIVPKDQISLAFMFLGHTQPVETQVTVYFIGCFL